MASTRAFARPTLPNFPAGQSTLLTTTPVATPTYASSQLSFSVISRTHISAPASLVARVILQAEKWGEWNSFIPSIAITSRSSDTTYPAGLQIEAAGLRRGDAFTMRANMAGVPLKGMTEGAIAKMQTTTEIVSLVEALDPEREEGRTGYRICWKLDGGFGGLLRAERVQECVDGVDGGCEWVTYESFGGWLGVVVRLTTGAKLVDRFGDWGSDLKVRAEEVHGRE